MLPRDIENELHFLFYCPLYHDLRTVLFDRLSDVSCDLFLMSNREKLNCLFQTKPFLLVLFMLNAWLLRKRTLYKLYQYCMNVCQFCVYVSSKPIRLKIELK